MYVYLICVMFVDVFFFQAEDGIRDLVRSRGLGDVYKRQKDIFTIDNFWTKQECEDFIFKSETIGYEPATVTTCLLYTSDAADERSSVDLGGRRIIKKKKNA